MIKDEIIEAYYRYRQMILDNYENPKHLNVVIRIKPEKFITLLEELGKEHIYLERDIEIGCHFIELAGRKTPIIIDDKLSEFTDFLIQSQRAYERQEQEEQLERFYKMFGD